MCNKTSRANNFSGTSRGVCNTIVRRFIVRTANSRRGSRLVYGSGSGKAGKGQSEI